MIIIRWILTWFKAIHCADLRRPIQRRRGGLVLYPTGTYMMIMMVGYCCSLQFITRHLLAQYLPGNEHNDNWWWFWVANIDKVLNALLQKVHECLKCKCMRETKGKGAFLSPVTEVALGNSFS